MKKIKYTFALLLLILTASCSNAIQSIPTTTTILQQKYISEPLSIAAVGDISCSSAQRKSNSYDCLDQQVSDVVRSANPDYVFLLGDIQYNTHSIKNFNSNFKLYWNDLIPISMPIPGNHEYDQSGAKGYYDTWGPSFGYDGYYSKLLNNDWLLIALNTNDECSFVSCSKSSDQYKWLFQQLQKHKNQCVIAMAHHPRYSSGAHGSSEALAPVYDLLSEYKVSLFLSGHDHHYERFNSSPVQYVVGTGGKDLRRVYKPISQSTYIVDDTHGVLFLEIFQKTVKTKFVDISGNLYDSHTVHCTKN